VILLYAAVARRQREEGAEALLPTGILAWGYTTSIRMGWSEKDRGSQGGSTAEKAMRGGFLTA
jgi:hypothetical protein